MLPHMCQGDYGEELVRSVSHWVWCSCLSACPGGLGIDPCQGQDLEILVYEKQL